MNTLPTTTLSLIESLQQHGIDLILYGSQGVALHIGPFKEFGDVDLLVPDEWVDERWGELISIMGGLGYSMIDEHEHEFKNQDDVAVGFAPESILTRDKIIEPNSTDIASVRLGQLNIRTLSAPAFRRAYEFSVKDGYRKNQRGKKDEEVITLLDNS